MTTPLEAIKAGIEALEPCPFCGGQPEIEEKRLNSVDMGGKPSALITVNIRHHCEKQPGVVNAFIEFRGRDHASAFAQWNTRAAHAMLSQVEAAQVPSAEEEQDRFEADAYTISSEVNHIPEVQNLPDLCTEDVWPHVERALVAVGRYYRAQVPSVEEVATALEHHLLELVVSAAKIPATDGPIVSASKRVELVLTFKQIILALFKGEKK